MCYSNISQNELCPSWTVDLHTRFEKRVSGTYPQTPEVYPPEEYHVKMKKSSNISAAALHRFIPLPASGRFSALPCLAALLVWSKLLWENIYRFFQYS